MEGIYKKTMQKLENELTATPSCHHSRVRDNETLKMMKRLDGAGLETDPEL